MADSTHDIVEYTKPGGPLMTIASRALDPNVENIGQFSIFTTEKLDLVASNMAEINRATKAFGRKNTQTTNRLMTLTMLADCSPFRVIRQCLAQIENKRQALKENLFKMAEKRIDLEELTTNGDLVMIHTEDGQEIFDRFATARKELQVQKLTSEIADSVLYIEGCLKDIASFQVAYQEVCKNNNIDPNWDEEDMERAEVHFHIKMGFLNAYRDVMAHGSLGMGTLEYLHQFGIHPQKALKRVRQYIQANTNDAATDFNSFEDWLDQVATDYEGEFPKVLKRLGLDQLYHQWFQYKENEDGQRT